MRAQAAFDGRPLLDPVAFQEGMARPRRNPREFVNRNTFALVIWRGDHAVRVESLAGDYTDGASIPPIFWPLVGPPLGGLYLRAAVVHDTGYRYNRLGMPRYWWDRCLLIGMRIDGVKAWRRFAMYRCLRRFGGLAASWRANGSRLVRA